MVRGTALDAAGYAGVWTDDAGDGLMHIVYKSEPERGRIWQRWLAAHAPDIQLHIWPETGDPEQVEALVAWQPPADITALFPG